MTSRVYREPYVLSSGTNLIWLSLEFNKHPHHALNRKCQEFSSKQMLPLTRPSCEWPGTHDHCLTWLWAACQCLGGGCWVKKNRISPTREHFISLRVTGIIYINKIKPENFNAPRYLNIKTLILQGNFLFRPGTLEADKIQCLRPPKLPAPQVVLPARNRRTVRSCFPISSHGAFQGLLRSSINTMVRRQTGEEPVSSSSNEESQR